MVVGVRRHDRRGRRLLYGVAVSSLLRFGLVIFFCVCMGILGWVSIGFGIVTQRWCRVEIPEH